MKLCRTRIITIGLTVIGWNDEYVFLTPTYPNRCRDDGVRRKFGKPLKFFRIQRLCKCSVLEDLRETLLIHCIDLSRLVVVDSPIDHVIKVVLEAVVDIVGLFRDYFRDLTNNLKISFGSVVACQSRNRLPCSWSVSVGQILTLHQQSLKPRSGFPPCVCFVQVEQQYLRLQSCLT